MESDMVMHHGGCHCRRVRWRVQAPSSAVAWNCNCSDCSMRGNTHFIVPSGMFELLGDSKECLTTYTFGTHTAKHTFYVWTQGLSRMLRLSTMMGETGKAHTIRQALLHAPKQHPIRPENLQSPSQSH
ncbi:MSS4-LIKE PROTEIN-RELATED [Salix purpurea]|uniref:MSS4-LIKE PROTEIN-RELATED n=1 Tax=Salix purpurea TaxID=77065 RepID=A0A9Q0URU1_SALPP|nr:MSS4-LIKE PROTEIN-RELATED [Salix purpurea]